MKRLSLVTVMMLLSLAVGAQGFNEWTHTNTNPFYQFSQCYDILELGDGNLVVKEAVFDNDEDLGYILYKITPECEVLDSLVVDDNSIYALYPMLRDPDRANSNILVSFFSNSKNYYMRTYFNDDLEITDEVITEYPNDMQLPNRFLVDSNSDIVCRIKVDNETYPSYRLMKMGLDGEIKALSDTLSPVFMFPEHGLFELSGNPIQYGNATCISDDGLINVDIFDENLNLIKSKSIFQFGEWKSMATPTMNAHGLSDGHFVMSLDVYKTSGMNVTEAVCVAELNSELELEGTYVWAEGHKNYYPLLNKNLIATDGGIYVAWLEKRTTGNQSQTHIAVTYLDCNLNHLWSRASNLFVNDGAGAGLFGGYGLTIMHDGSLALSGWMTNEYTYYQSKTIYAIVYRNDVWSTDNPPVNDAPFFCYPNPAQNTVNITFSDEIDCQSIEIYSIDGRIVETYGRASLQTAIDISNLNPGVYILKVNMADGREFTERIVKK